MCKCVGDTLVLFLVNLVSTTFVVLRNDFVLFKNSVRVVI